MKRTDVQFTAKDLKAIGVDVKNLPTLPEALEAKKECDIAKKQGIGLFLSKPVKFVVLEIKSRCEDSVLLWTDIFNYGYILGKRAERARRKGVK